jgi:spermidine/putrescine transport system substrate-binding protein
MKHDVNLSDELLSRRQILKGGAGLAAGGAMAALLGTSAAAAAARTLGHTAAATVKPTVDGDLNWLTWEEYIPDSVVSGFEKHYGVKVTQSYMTDDEQYVQKLAAGQPFDLITTNSAYMPQTIGGNLVQGFSPSSLKNWDQVIPYFKKPFYDNGAVRYTIPYGYSPTGVAYVEGNGLKITGTWNDLWNNPQAKGHIYVLDQIEETIGASLLRDKYSLNSANPNQVKQAVGDLEKLKPYLGGITTNITSLLDSGQAQLIHAWSTQTYLAITGSKKYGSKIKFYLPKDGAPVACDTLSIGAHAKAPGTALLFMDWILSPSNNAALGAYALQKTGAAGGNAAFDKAVAKYPMFKFDDSKVLSNSALWKVAPTGSRLSLYNQEWSQFSA